ncbi:MAG: hypothetical protein ABIZ49_06480, partial [Opitutaceae bacterium]
LERCYDLVLLGRAHRALAYIRREENKSAVAADHARKALAYFQASRKSSPDERRELRALIAHCST